MPHWFSTDWPGGLSAERVENARVNNRFARFLAGLAVSVTCVAGAAERPRVGLVLGGGGARGAAHVGVLEVLQQLRVPVDCVAGTSMGALVAGAWAAGLEPAALRQALAAADWADMFLDNPEFEELNFRTKRLSRRFLPGSESGLRADGLVAPPGVVAGQKIKLFFNQLVRADTGELDLEDLPLPVSMIATDIASGERIVFREGSLTQAMRASMAVPGLLAPLAWQGRKLVDGGLVDNVPIREARERCNADVVIAVNVGSPLLKAEQITGLLSVSAQMVAILTEQNVSQSLATLKPGDVYIKPELGDIGAGAFERHAEAAEIGRAAALAAAERLAPLAVGVEEYARWRQRLQRRPVEARRVDAIEIEGLSRVNPEVLRRYLQQRPGEPLDTQALNRDLLRAYGDGWYESVDYALVHERGRRVLRVLPVEKTWGPDYLRLALNLDSNLSQGSTYSLRAAYQKTWLNALGADLLVSAELGNRTGFGVELHQPLEATQRWFVEASAAWQRERADLFLLDQRISEYRIASTTLDLLAGVNFPLLGQARLGWRELHRKGSLDTGLPLLSGESLQAAGWLASLELDQLNRLYFPTRGWALRGSWFVPRDRPYQRLGIEGRYALPLGDWVLAGRASWVSSPRGRLADFDAATLGGFLNLSGFANGQLIGDDARYAHLRAERIVGRLPLGLRGDMRLGVALEAGRLKTPFLPIAGGGNGWLDSTAIYLGGETPVGSVYIGLGHSSAGATNAYLFIGTP